MICHKCRELIETGEACIAEPMEWGRYRYFHPHCHVSPPVEPREEPLTREQVKRMLGINAERR